MALSRDGGSSWELAVEGLDDLAVRDLVLDAEGGPVAAAGTGVYRLDLDAGRWSRTGDQDLPSVVTALATVPGRSQVLYAGTARHAVWRSENGGATWRRIFNGVALRAVVSLAVPADEPDTLHAVGAASSACTGGLPGEAPGVYTTRDGGEEWYLTSWDTSGRPFYAAAAIGDTLYYGTSRGLAIHRGSLSLGYGLEDEVVSEILGDPFHQDRILAASYRLWVGPRFQLGLYHPKWREIGRGLPERERLTALAADRQRPGVFYAGTDFGGLHRSFDGGETWHEVRPPAAEP